MALVSMRQLLSEAARGGIEDGHGAGEVSLTDPDRAVEFVERIWVDALGQAGNARYEPKPLEGMAAAYTRHGHRLEASRGDPPARR